MDDPLYYSPFNTGFNDTKHEMFAICLRSLFNEKKYSQELLFLSK